MRAAARIEWNRLKYELRIFVNGRLHERQVEARTLLVELLREELGLTGTHVGCEGGACGACTVLLNGKAVKSCNLLALQADGASVTTVEGVATDAGPPSGAGAPGLHPIQEALWQRHAAPCGFCAPGLVLASKDLLDCVQEPTREMIRRALDGTVCACAGHQHAIEAVEDAAARSRASPED
jgi:carbon-monoxide dehydrogenase small subunit